MPCVNIQRLQYLVPVSWQPPFDHNANHIFQKSIKSTSNLVLWDNRHAEMLKSPYQVFGLYSMCTPQEMLFPAFVIQFYRFWKVTTYPKKLICM